MLRNFTLFMLALIPLVSSAQTQFWSDTFEDTGAPSSGTRTPSTTFSCGSPATAYFFRTDLAGITLQNSPYGSFQGSKFWAGEDTDFGPSCVNASIAPQQNITWSGINISGKTGLSFRGLFAANHINGGWEGTNFAPNQDYLTVEYRIDGGSWNRIIAFYANAISSSPALYLETTNDLIGDGPMLTYTMTEFTANIVGTGTLLDLRFGASANNAASEEFAIDNFRLFEALACTNPTVTSQPSFTAVCLGSNASFSVAATGATAYQWQVNTGSGFTNISNGVLYSNVNGTTLNITAPTQAMSTYLYRCIVSSGSCSTTTADAMLIVSNPNLSPLSQSNVTCFGGSNGQAAVNVASGGFGPYTYNWTPGNPTGDGTVSVSGLTAGAWTCTVTDNAGCTASAVFNITQPASAVSGSTSVTNVSCNGGSNGTINLTPSGGTGPYTFNWGGGITSEDRTGLTAGTYSVTITDNNGCTGNVSATVTQPASAVSGSTSVTNVSCNGGSNGTINLTPSGGTGPYTFNWGGGITTEDRTGLPAGTYSVTITDNNGCTGNASATVTQPASAVSGSTAVTNVSCNGGNNGAINLTPSGGTGPYTFNWGGGITTEDRTGLPAGTYSVTITDNNGCTGNASATVTQPASAVSGSTTVTNVSCNGGSNGTINLTPSGGTGPYTFNWGGGITTEDRTGLPAGTYSVTITDNNGCAGNASATVTQPASAVSGSTSVTNVSCNGGSNGTINLTPSGGTGPYTFNWGGGITTEDRTGLPAGTYSVTITDNNGCTGNASATVTQPAPITTVFTETACGSYTLNAQTYTVSGTYNQLFTAVNGCDSTVILNLNITICSGYQWTGALSTDWNTAGNWNLASVPNNCASDVSIPLTANQPQVNGLDISVGNLVVSDGVSITIQNGFNLNVCGNLNAGNAGGMVVSGGSLNFTGTSAQQFSGELLADRVQLSNAFGLTMLPASEIEIAESISLLSGTWQSNGNLKLLSDASGTAFLDDFTPGYTGSVSGDIIVERFIPIGLSGFRQLGTPVQLNDISDIAGFTPSGTPGFIVPLPTCDPNYVASNSPYGNWMQLVENASPQFACAQSLFQVLTSGTMQNGRGYYLDVPGNTVISFTGEANSGPVSYTLTHANAAVTNGWNMVSNPYPSPLAWELVNVPAGVDAIGKIWVSSGTYTGTFQDIDPNDSGTQSIAIGQAFQVRVSTPGASVSFSLDDTDRTVQAPTYLFAGETPMTLNIDILGNGFADLSKIRFIEGATAGMDALYDSPKMLGNANQPMVYSLVNGIKYSTNSYASLNQVMQVPLGVKIASAGQHSFVFSNLDQFPASAMIYLEDTQTGIMQNVRTAAQYDFVANTGIFESRFVIHFYPPLVYNTESANCETKGSLLLPGNAYPVWNFSLKNAQGTELASGTTDVSHHIQQLDAGLYTLSLSEPVSGYTATENIEITGVEQVIAAASASATQVGLGENVSFTSTGQGATQWHWNFGDMNTSNDEHPVHSYNASGLYTVSLTAGNADCESTATLSIQVNSGASVSDQILDFDGVNIWVQDQLLQLSFTQVWEGKITVSVFDLSGKLVSMQQIYNQVGNHQISLENVVPGIYLVQLQNANKTVAKKISVNKN